MVRCFESAEPRASAPRSIVLAHEMSESSLKDKKTPSTAPAVGASGPRARLGDLLVNAEIVERKVVEKTVTEARSRHERLGEALSRQGIVEPIDIWFY